MSRKKAIFFFIVIIAFIIGAIFLLYPSGGIDLSKLFPASKPIPFGFYKVTEIYDGDTFAINMNGRTEKVRLIGVDTPETHDPNTPEQCYGKEATEFTTKLLKDADYAVRLEADSIGDNRDRYDRLLRYAYLPSGVLLEQAIIEGGYGFAYLSFPFSKQNDFAEYQASAQSDKRNIWSACRPTLTNKRWQSSTLSQ